GKARAEAPVVGDVSVPGIGAEIFVGVAKGDRRRVRHAEEEAREVVAGGGPVESEGSARVLLRERVPLLAAELESGSDIVQRNRAEDFERYAVALIGGGRILRFAQRRNPVREVERGRSPVDRLLVVARNAGDARNIRAIRKERYAARGGAVELIAEIRVKT